MANKKNDDTPIGELPAVIFNAMHLISELEFKDKEDLLRQFKVVLDEEVRDNDELSTEEKKEWYDTYDYIKDEMSWESINGFKTLQKFGILSVESADNEQDDEGMEM